MEEIIQYQIDDNKIEEVTDLDLQGYKTENLSINDKHFLEQFVNLESLSFSSSGLKSLEHFPSLPKLIRLDLDDNEIKSGLKFLNHLEEIMQICLKNNQIEKIEEFQSISNLPSLVCLDLYGCPVSLIADYRKELFNLFPCLQIIDGVNREGQDMSLSDLDSDDSQEFSEEFSEEFSDSSSEDPKPRKK